METKYIFVTGGVVSSLGKGIISASIGKLLQARGYKITIQKFDPYINIDPGTLNPYEHGECYVTADGMETDLDLGHYERFIDEGMNNPSQPGKAYIDESRNFCIDGWQFETNVMLREPANKVTDEMRTKVAYVLNSHYDIPANTRQIIFKKSAVYDWDVYVLSRVKTTMSDGSNDQYFYSLEKFAKMAADEINSKISLG